MKDSFFNSNHFRKYLAAAALIIASCVTVSGQDLKKGSPFVKKYPPARLREDARLFANVTLAMHPSVGIYHDKEKYARLFTAFVESINDSLTEKQFRLKLKLIADQLHCGHTEVLYSKAYYRQAKRLRLKLSPYVFLPVGDKVYVFGNLKKDSLIRIGAEISHINGVAVDSMIRYSRRFISSDGFNNTSRDHYLQAGFNSYYAALFGRPDTFSVTYRFKDDSTATARYSAFTTKKVPPLRYGPKADSLVKKFKRAAIEFRFLDNSNKTMYMRISKFSTNGEKRAYRKIFRKMRRRDTENLVIDLRNNGGGSLLNSYRLLSYVIDEPKPQSLKTRIRRYPYKQHTRGNVWFRFTRFVYGTVGKKTSVNGTDIFTYTIKPSKRNHFSRQLYFLINGGSFSASSLVAAYAKATGRAVFIGQETGGAKEGCNAGITPYYKLPNTKLRVRMPAFRVVNDVYPEITGQGVMPDYGITYTFDDLLRRRDLEMEKVKELLNIP